MATNWKLSPSDLTFLWEECKRCFYLKVVREISRPFIMPKIFNKIDSIMNQYFFGKNTTEINPVLPPGTVLSGNWVGSQVYCIAWPHLYVLYLGKVRHCGKIRGRKLWHN